MDQIIVSALELLLVVTGRFAVWLFSFGRWRGEALTSDEGSIYGAAGALSFVRDGRRVITHTGQLFAGTAFYLLLAAAGILYAVSV
jgi:hypothetical protein